MIGSISPEMLLAILPEILLLAVVAVVFVADLLLPEQRRGSLAWITAAGLAITMLLTVFLAVPGAEAELMWGGMLRHDWLAFIFKLLFLLAALLTTLFTIGWEPVWRKGEFYVLLLTSTIGMTLMAASADLIMLFLAIETTSIPLYVMAGFMTYDDKSTESGFKYLLFGAVTTGVMLYGLSLLYGFAGTTNLYEMAAGLSAASIPGPVLVGTLFLILLGFGFKVALVPLHFWAPDVYEGAPTPVTAFLSTASKAAGFAVLVRVLLAAFPGILTDWQAIVAIAADVRHLVDVEVGFVGNYVLAETVGKYPGGGGVPGAPRTRSRAACWRRRACTASRARRSAGCRTAHSRSSRARGASWTGASASSRPRWGGPLRPGR